MEEESKMGDDLYFTCREVEYGNGSFCGLMVDIFLLCWDNPSKRVLLKT